MIFVQGWIDLNPDDLAKVIPAASKMTEETNNEDGCIHYCFAQDISNSGRIHISERWKDEDSLNAHFQTAHMATFNGTLSGLNIKSMDIRMYTGDEVKVMMQS